MAPRRRQPPQPPLRAQVTTTLRQGVNQDTTTLASLRGKTPYWGHPTDYAQERAVAPPRAGGTGRGEVPAVNYSALSNTTHSAYPVKCLTDRRGNIIAKKRPIPPCPCPDDIKPVLKSTRREDGDTRRQTSFGENENLDITDHRGYCRMMTGKLSEIFFRTTGPMQHNLRGRLLAEQTWFELQSKLFLPTPATTQRNFMEVLQRLEKKRETLARKERSIWKQVGQLFTFHTF